MIILSKNKPLIPLVDIIEEPAAAKKLQTVIHEYIDSNKYRAQIGNGDFVVFYASGMARYHHRRLADYFNATALKDKSEKAELRFGSFSNFPARHCWIKVGGIIIDIAIKQFAEPLIRAFASQTTNLADNDYFICDNIKNPLYSLYQER